MNPDLMVDLVVLAAVFLMLAINRLRPDAVALLAMVVLPFTGVVTVPVRIASRSGAATGRLMLPMADAALIGRTLTLALERTGGVGLASEAPIAPIGDANPRVMLASLFGITALLGLFIVNTANAVLLVPWRLPLS